MANLIRYYLRASHPRGFWGKLALKAMNGKKHEALPNWVLDELQIGEDANVLAKDSFDLVTAFETVYFWPILEEGLAEIFRVLKPGGTCVIANEMDGLDPNCRKMEHAVGMLVYTINEITEPLKELGFTGISSRHDESRHFICITARKPK